MIRRAAAALLAICVVAAAPGAANGASFEIPPGSLAVRMLDSEDKPDNRAGAHPDRLQIDFGLTVEGTGTSARDLLFDLSPGIASNVNAVPLCPRNVFEEEIECPADTQVGVLKQAVEGEELELPVFDVQPAPGEAATFGSKPLWKIPMSAELRPDDFGLTLAIRNLAQISLGSGSVELWGIPADHQEGTEIPRRPFLTTPTRCEPLEVTFRARSWQVGAPWLSQTARSEAPLSDCQDLPFAPKLAFSLSNPVADSPSGAQVELEMPENTDPDGRSSSQFKRINIQLPDGVSVSPGGAEGISTCSDAQFGLGDADKPSCPPGSKVGSMKVESPELRTPLEGSLYLGAERPGERFRLFLGAIGSGVTVKLSSTLNVDPVSGRIAVALDDLPQVPITHLALSFDGGPHALLATPLGCGSPTSTGKLEPNGGGSAVNASATTSIDSSPAGRCQNPLPFAPRLIAGSSNPLPGRATSFSMTMRREDGEQLPTRFAVTLPKGLSAAVGAVGRCSGPAASAGSCPAGSGIGSAFAEIGSGDSPALLRGEAFLTEPYRRAPFGLALVFPARVGPFDLGKFVIRGALRLDRHNGQITIETDPLPQTVEGLPVRIRTIGIDMDRAGFLRNPTSCRPASVDALLQGSGGATAAASSPFSLLGCEKLGFRPRFSIAMVGRSELRKGGKPGLSVSARFRRGNTNLRMLKLSFPPQLKLDLSALNEFCSRRDAANGLCGKRSQLGSVSARSPLLAKPLSGGVFIAQPKGDGLPDLWFSLAGEGVHLDLRAESSRVDGRFAIRLAGLPDLPLSVLKMSLPGGEEGAFSLDRALCAKGRPLQLSSPVVASGQDGAYRETQVRVGSAASCGNADARMAQIARPVEPWSLGRR